MADRTVLHVGDTVLGVKPATSVQVDGARVDPPPRLFPQVKVQTSTQPDDDTRDDGNKVGEKVLRIGRSIQRPHAEVELSNDQQHAPNQTPPRSHGERPRLPGELVDRAALDLPRVAHADVREADHAPAEQRDERGQVGEPGEDGRAGFVDVEEGETTANDEGRDEAPPGTANTVGFLHLLCVKDGG